MLLESPGDAFTLGHTVVMWPVSQLWSVQGQHRRVILESPATTHCISGAAVKHSHCENHSLMDLYFSAIKKKILFAGADSNLGKIRAFRRRVCQRMFTEVVYVSSARCHLIPIWVWNEPSAASAWRWLKNKKTPVSTGVEERRSHMQL